MTNSKISCFWVFFIALISCQNNPANNIKSGHSEEWSMTGFVKQDVNNPILSPSVDSKFLCSVRGDSVAWESRNVLNPTALVKDNKVYLLYRAQDAHMTSRIGMAVSEDGIHFQTMVSPIFYPEQDSMMVYEWPGGVEDPRIVENEEGLYILTYTSYDGKKARLCLASSTNLIEWQKHGLVLGTGKYRDVWSKSGAIVVRQEGNKMIATKINGKYWMYFGDTDLFMANSDDLIHWTALEDERSAKLISVLHPRKGYFDSRLVEPGPYALLTEDGILLIYNASNAANFNDPKLPKSTYAAGQALFDKNAPYKLIARTKSYFMHPDKDYERIGEVNEVCFLEGMVYFKDKWFLYYGTADSKIAVAVK